MAANDALRAAGGIGGGYLLAKLALPAAALFLAGLLIAGALADPGAAMADTGSCGDRGEPSVPPVLAGPYQEQQLANAEIIDTVAVDAGLPGQATLIALMTALQESSLFNLDHGDRDSLGLFQQRPSMGWGTPEQLTDPVYATKAFLGLVHDGEPSGLTDLAGWQDMEPGRAAQAVQRSAYPQLYANHEAAARAIAGHLDIDLDRPGDDPAPTPTEHPAVPGECYTGDGGGKPGDPFEDGVEGWPLQVNNPLAHDSAITYARNQAESGGKDWYRLCLAFVAQAYGWGGSGVDYAIDHYREMPEEMRHDKDRNPPPGALLYWDTGQRAGHVALYLGDGQVASNDILRAGYIDIVDAADIERVWGAEYLGWAPPYFPQGW